MQFHHSLRLYYCVRNFLEISLKLGEMAKVYNKREKKNSKFVCDDDEKTTDTLESASIRSKTEFAPGRFVVYSRYNDQDYVHIREYVTLNGKEYPSKKGVSFTPSRLKSFMKNFALIDEELKQRSSNASYKVEKATSKIHIGAGIFASVNLKFNGVDLRRFFAPDGFLFPIPTKNGIYVSSFQWSTLKEKLTALVTLHPELKTAEECFHQNQMGALDCRECLPFGSKVSL